jgi:small subunit ribosomal protein S16
MATVIRFARHGTKKRPYYRIVVQDQHSPRDGRFIDHIGAYNPIKGETSLVIQRDRLEYWLSTGAQMSTSVANRLKQKRKEWTTAGASPEVAPKAAAKAPVDKPSKKPAKKPASKEA